MHTTPTLQSQAVHARRHQDLVAGEESLAYTCISKATRHFVSFVRLVFLGKNQSEGGRVEKRLAELGCPGFEAYNGVHKDGAGRLDGQ
jgi:hypothetical protein